jgi:hypothetical protein
MASARAARLRARDLSEDGINVCRWMDATHGASYADSTRPGRRAHWGFHKSTESSAGTDQAQGKFAHACCTVVNPRGGDRKQSYDPQLSQLRIPCRATKGGSHLSAPNYCRRYRPAARMPPAVGTAAPTSASAASSCNRTERRMDVDAGGPSRAKRAECADSGRDAAPDDRPYWWLTALRGLVALLLALAIAFPAARPAD